MVVPTGLPWFVPASLIRNCQRQFRIRCCCRKAIATKTFAVITQGILSEHEKFSVERAIRLMDAPVAMKSNLHNVLFAPGLGKLWVANASSDKKPAWTQKYYEFDFRALLKQPFPTTGKEYPLHHSAAR